MTHTDTHPTHFRAAVVVTHDVIELDGVAWRVVSGRTTKVVRTLVLRPLAGDLTRTIRPRRDAPVRMLHPYVPGA
jgi:hypothetical protein